MTSPTSKTSATSRTSTATTSEQQAALAAAIGAQRVREAGTADAVDGVHPTWVATVDGTEQVSAALRVASEHGLRVVARGSGSKIDWGRPPTAVDLVLDLSPAKKILEHAAGDLVLRAQAGTPLAEIQHAVSAAGQQLALDQPLPSATVGGVIATGTAGPGRHLYGSVRDLLIGITTVRADGTVTVSGGKVVKNVAGYDLGKLYTGSFGTLGVITEAVFRLHPLSHEHRWVTADVPDSPSAALIVRAIRRSQSAPTAIEIDRGEPDGRIAVCAQLDGRAGATQDRADQLFEAVTSAAGAPAEIRDSAPDWWGRFPFDAASGIGLRLSVEPASVGQLLTAAQDAADEADLPLAVRGSAGVGVLHCGLPGDTDPRSAGTLIEKLRASAANLGGHAVLLRAPQAVKGIVDPWGPMPEGLLTLMRRTKNQFDPNNLLAPGRFVGGI